MISHYGRVLVAFLLRNCILWNDITELYLITRPRVRRPALNYRSQLRHLQINSIDALLYAQLLHPLALMLKLEIILAAALHHGGCWPLILGNVPWESLGAHALVVTHIDRVVPDLI